MNLIDNIKKNKLYYSSLLIVIIVGIWFRIKGLGKWPLAVDEYYIVKSIENILQYGLPQFEAGGYYERGIIYQYLTAFLMLIGIKTEFAARLLPVISNILVIPPLYLLAKKISGKMVVLIVTTLFCFSLWEIEFARFARMYAPFQALHIWYVYFLYKVVVENKNKDWSWLFFLSFISIFIYEGSVLILALNFSPFIIQYKFKIKQFIISVALIAFNYIYLRINFRGLGNTEIFPPGVKDYHANLPGTGGLLKKPLVLLSSVFDDYSYGIVFILLCILTCYYLIKVFKSTEFNFKSALSLTSLFIAIILNQFGLAIILFVIYILLEWIDFNRIKSNKYSKNILTIVFLVFSFWLIFSLTTDAWYSLYSDFNPNSIVSVLKRTFALFVSYPGTYGTFWLFYDTVPFLTIFVFIILTAGLIVVIRNSSTQRYSERFLFLVLIVSLIMSTYLVTGKATRYSFYIFPIILLLVSISVQSVARIITKVKIKQYIFILGTLLVFISFSEDYKINHLLNIDSQYYNFRVGYNEMLEKHYYRRYDVKTPAEYVNTNIKNDEIVLVNEMILEYYLDKLDYIFIDYKSRRFPILSTTQGTKERWTNANLIYTTDSLLDFLLENNKNIWFVVHKMSYIQEPLLEIDFYNKFKNYLVYESIDKMVAVYKIPNLSECL